MSWFNQTKLKPKNTNIYDDGSASYTNNKKAKLYIFDENTKRVLVFKPFIDSLSYSFSYKLEDNDTKNALVRGSQKTVDGIECKISLSINLLATTIDEARTNLSKINELTRIMKKIISTKVGTEKKRFTANNFGVYLSNLISSGKAKIAPQELSNHVEAYNNALFGYIENFKFDLSSKELGFFDINKKLIPKQTKISFDLLISFASNYILGGNDIFLPFSPNNSYYPSDVKYWPFSINDSVSGLDQTYSTNKNAFVTFWNNNCSGQSVKYDLFLDSLNSSVARTGKTQKLWGLDFYQKIETLSMNYKFDFAFEVPSANRQEGRINMAKFQKLIRIINNFNPKFGTTITRNNITDLIDGEPELGKTQNRILMSNLINTGADKTTDPSQVATNGVPCMIESITFEPNLDLGLYDDGLLIFKSYKLSLKCEIMRDETNKNQNTLRSPYNTGIAGKNNIYQYTLQDNEPAEDFIFIDDHDSLANIKTSVAPKYKEVDEENEEKDEENEEKDEENEEKDEENETPPATIPIEV